MNKARLFIVFVSVLVTNLGWAHSGSSCSNVTVKTFTEHQPRYMHESGPFHVLGKRWSTSDELKRYFDQQKTLLKHLKEQPPLENVESKLKLASVGDLMRMPSDQPGFVNEVLKEYLDTVDILTGNLETLISPKYPVPPSSLFLMNSDPSLMTAFRNKENVNYFSAVSLANNHTFDYPDDAIKDTMGFLNKEGVWQSGIRVSESEKPYLVMEKNGIRVGYYAITTFVNDPKRHGESSLHLTPMVKGIEPLPFSAWKDGCEVDLSDTKKVLKQMEQDGADIKVISIHWGIEYDMYPQPVQMDIAHQLVQQGADVIVGSHPHVPQPAEICFVNGYEESLGVGLADTQKQQGCVIKSSDGVPRKAMIYYSLGNLTSYSPFFWQQVGVIGELNLVKRKTPNGNTVDWIAPDYLFTYDHVENPPHGKRHLNTLNNYLVRRCEASECTTEIKVMAGILSRHLTGKSFSWWEELRASSLSAYEAIKNILFWTLFAPEERLEAAGG